jgi:hypothetical protein
MRSRGLRLPHLLHFFADPIGATLEHGKRNRVLGVEIVIEARFADADLVGDVLEAEAFEAPRLNQALGRV